MQCRYFYIELLYGPTLKVTLTESTNLEKIRFVSGNESEITLESLWKFFENGKQ